MYMYILMYTYTFFIMKGVCMKGVFRFGIYFFTFFAMSILVVLLGYLFLEALPFFKQTSLTDFIFGRVWRATEVNQSFQIFNMLVAGIYIALLACLISFPLSYGMALFICFYAKGFVKKGLTWLVNILSGIPSIVYGFFCMMVLLKLIENIFTMSAGESVLAGSIILAIMIIPFFVSICIENIETTIKKYRRDSDFLGMSKEYFIYKIVFRESLFSILTGFLLAFARATGETMAVMMVIGNSPQFPSLLSKAETIPSLIALEIGMSEVGSIHYSALFSAALILLLLVLVINIIFFALNRLRQNYINN